MQVSTKAFAVTIGILWATVMLVAGLMNLAYPAYAHEFLEVMQSVYPGFHHDGTVGDLLIGVLWSLIDGAVAALVLAWLYNFFAARFAQTS